MKYGRNLFATAEEKGKTGYIYGDIEREQRFLRGADQYLRYAPLARKALRHYAKDAYDPHTIDFAPEWWVRRYVANFIIIKVENKVQYDWEFIDNFMKMVIGDLLTIDIPYNEERLNYLIPEAQVPEPMKEKDTNHKY